MIDRSQKAMGGRAPLSEKPSGTSLGLEVKIKSGVFHLSLGSLLFAASIEAILP